MKKIFYTSENEPAKKLSGMMWAVDGISGYNSFLWDHKKISIFELYQKHPDCHAILVSENTVPQNHCQMFATQYPEVKLIYVHNDGSLNLSVEFSSEINLKDVPFMTENRLMFGRNQEYLKSDFVVFADNLSKEQVAWLNTIGGIASLRVYGKRPQFKLNNYCGILLNSQMKDCMASVKNVIMFEPSLAPTVKSLGLKAIVCPDHFKSLEELVGIVKAIKGGLDINSYDWSNLEYRGETLDKTSLESYQDYVMQKII